MKTTLSIFFVFFFSSFCNAGGPTFMGAERTGFAISVEDAIEIARPYYYQSFKLRNPSSNISEKEYFDSEYYQIFVYLDDGKYKTFRDLPKKLASQHLEYPVVVDIFSGEASEPQKPSQK